MVVVVVNLLCDVLQYALEGVWNKTSQRTHTHSHTGDNRHPKTNFGSRNERYYNNIFIPLNSHYIFNTKRKHPRIFLHILAAHKKNKQKKRKKISTKLL